MYTRDERGTKTVGEGKSKKKKKKETANNELIQTHLHMQPPAAAEMQGGLPSTE